MSEGSSIVRGQCRIEVPKGARKLCHVINHVHHKLILIWTGHILWANGEGSLNAPSPESVCSRFAPLPLTGHQARHHSFLHKALTKNTDH